MDPPSPNNSRNNSQVNSCDKVNTSVTDMRTPLMGVDLSLIAAISLAGAVDRIGANSTVDILNFAHIQLTSQRNLLGRGSFSKVYRYFLYYILFCSLILLIYKLYFLYIN